VTGQTSGLNNLHKYIKYDRDSLIQDYKLAKRLYKPSTDEKQIPAIVGMYGWNLFNDFTKKYNLEKYCEDGNRLPIYRRFDKDDQTPDQSDSTWVGIVVEGHQGSDRVLLKQYYDIPYEKAKSIILGG